MFSEDEAPSFYQYKLSLVTVTEIPPPLRWLRYWPPAATDVCLDRYEGMRAGREAVRRSAASRRVCLNLCQGYYTHYWRTPIVSL